MTLSVGCLPTLERVVLLDRTVPCARSPVWFFIGSLVSWKLHKLSPINTFIFQDIYCWFVSKRIYIFEPTFRINFRSHVLVLRNTGEKYLRQGILVDRVLGL
jgi:hypothetical protein